MAIVTHQLGGDGVVNWELDYNDVSMVVVALRCKHGSVTVPAVDGTLYRNSDNLFIQGTFTPGLTASIPAPTLVNKMVLTKLANGKLDGVTLVTNQRTA